MGASTPPTNRARLARLDAAFSDPWVTAAERVCQTLSARWAAHGSGGAVSAISAPGGWNRAGNILLVTGGAETEIPNTQQGVGGTPAGSVSLSWDIFISQNNGTSKSATIRVRKGSTAGTILASQVIAAPGDANSVTGHQSSWSSTYTDATPGLNPSYFFTVDETGGDGTTEIWSDTRWIVLVDGGTPATAGYGAGEYHQRKAVRIDTTADASGAALSLSDSRGRPFKSGHTYAVALSYYIEPPTASGEMAFTAKIGQSTDTAEAFLYQIDTDPPALQQTMFYWTPTADRTAVTLDVYREASGFYLTGAWPIYVAWVDVFEVLPGMPLSGFYSPPPDQLYASGWEFRSGNGFGVNVSDSSLSISSYRVGFDIDTAGIDISDSYFYGWVEHTPADFSEEGYNWEVGEDYLGWYASEFDSDTVEFYADVSGGYTFRFRSRGGKHWVFEPEALADSPAVPALGMLPQYATEPHVGTETEGESYYDTVLHVARTWDGSAWQDWWVVS